MADNTNNELLKRLDLLTKAINSMGGSTTRPMGSSSSGSSGDTGRKSHLATKQAAKSASELADSLGDAEDAISDFQDSLNAASKASSKYLKTIFEADHVTNKAIDNMREELEKASGGLEGMVGSMIKSSSSMDDIKQQMDLMNHTTNVYNKILDKANAKTLTGIKSQTEMHAAIDMFAANMRDVDAAQAKAGADIIQMTEAMAKETNAFEKGALAAKIKTLEESTVGAVEEFKKLEAGLAATATGAASFKKITDTSTRLNNVFNGLNATVDAAANSMGWGQIFTLSGSFSLLQKGVTGAYTQLLALGKAGQAGSWDAYSNAIMGSIKLGVSTEKLAAVMQDGARQVGQLGSKGFIDTLNRGQLGLMQLGLTTEEAIEGVSAFTKTAQIGGVDIRNKEALDNSIKTQTNNFKRLSAMTGVTLKQFDDMNNSLLNDNNMRTSLMRTGIAERGQRLQEISLERERLVTMGASNEQAQAMIKATNDVLQMKVKDRLEAAAKMQQAAGISGMGAEGANAANIMRKGSRATTEEKAQLADFSAQLKGRMETMAGEGGLGMENLMDTIDDGMPGAAKALLDAGGQLKMAADAQMGLTLEEKSRLIAARGLPAGTAEFEKTMKQAGALFSQPIMALLGGVIGLTWAITKLNTMSKLAGKGGLAKEAGDHVNDALDYMTKGKAKGAASEAASPAKSISEKILGMKGVAAPAAEAASGAGAGAASAGGLLGKAGGIGGKLASGLGGLLKFAGPIAAGLTAAYGAFEGWSESAETFATDTASTGQKVSGAIGGAIGTLTAGLIDGPGAARAIYDVAGATGDAFSSIWTGVKTMWEKYILPGAKLAIDMVGDYLMMPFKMLASIFGKIGSVAAKLLGLDSSTFDAIKEYGDDNLLTRQYSLESKQDKDKLAALDAEKSANASKKSSRQQEAAQRDAKIAADKAGTAAKGAGDASVSAAKAMANADTLHKSSMDSISASSLITESTANAAAAGKINVPASINTPAASSKDDAAVTNKSGSGITKTTSSTEKQKPELTQAELLAQILEQITALVTLEQQGQSGVSTANFSGRNAVPTLNGRDYANRST